MATYLNKGTGPLLTAGTWANPEAGSSAQNTTLTGATNTTTSYVQSGAFTVTNADSVAGVLLYCQQLTSTGTVTIGISINGSTYNQELTVNATDLPLSPSWVFFALPFTGTGVATNKLAVKSSSANNAAFWRSTAGNWSRLFFLTTSPGSAPTTSDILYVAGRVTAAGATTPYTMTWNDTAATIFGAVTVGNAGTITAGVVAGTAYTMKLAGLLQIWGGGEVDIAASGGRMPPTSTFELFLSTASVTQYGVEVKAGGTLKAYGATKTVTAKLAANAAANATSLTTDVSTSWASADKIAVASTTRTAGDCEQGTMNGAASGTSLTVNGFAGTGGGLAVAHSGTAPTQAEIINLTRNVFIHGTTGANSGYILFDAAATVILSYVQMYFLGSNTANKRAVDIQTTAAGSCLIEYSSLHDVTVASADGFYVSGAASDGITLSHNVAWSITNNAVFIVTATSGVASVIDSNICIKNTCGICLADLGVTFTNNTVSGSSGQGIILNETGAVLGSNSGNVIHSCTSHGMQISNTATGALGSLTAWRNSGNAVMFSQIMDGLVVNSLTAFGNTTANLYFAGASGRVVLSGATLDSDASFATTSAIYWNNAVSDLRIFDSSIGATTPHTNTLYFNGSTVHQVYFHNTSVADTNLTNALANDPVGASAVHFQAFGKTVGDNRTYFPNGVVQTDATIYHTAGPSEKVTPSSATRKRESSPRVRKVASGATCAFSIWVRKSKLSTGDAADYNGAQPRLILRACPEGGIAADVAVDTMVAAIGDWEQLTYTSVAVAHDCVLDWLVDCDGTAGFINICAS